LNLRFFDPGKLPARRAYPALSLRVCNADEAMRANNPCFPTNTFQKFVGLVSFHQNIVLRLVRNLVHLSST